MERNNSSLFFLSDAEVGLIVSEGQSFVCSTENWEFEDITDLELLINTDPSKSKLFSEVIRILLDNSTSFNFENINTHWSNWLFY